MAVDNVAYVTVYLYLNFATQTFPEVHCLILLLFVFGRFSERAGPLAFHETTYLAIEVYIFLSVPRWPSRQFFRLEVEAGSSSLIPLWHVLT